MTSVQESVIDGVPVFWADGPGPLTGGLVFRVGQADEALTGRGLTHLVEHLALAPLVGTTLTTFEVEGETEDCADDGRLLTVERNACRAVELFTDEACVLWGADSIRLFVHAAMWIRGEEAVAAIRELFDPSLMVDTGEPSGYEPPIEGRKDPNGSTRSGLLRRLRRR